LKRVFLEKNNLICEPISKRAETKIISLKVYKEKLTAQLDDGRELSIPID